MRPGAAWARAGVVLGLVLVADQATKALVVASVARGGRKELLPVLDIVNVRNRGVAFGVLQEGGTPVTVVIVIALVALLAFFARHAARPLFWLPTGLLLGGALGNAVDRLREGAVVDFVKLPAWPAFNLADAAITVGVIVLLYVLEGPPRRRAGGHGAERPA